MRNSFGGQAYVFFNRLMDVMELSPGAMTGDLDAQELRGTGIPFDVRAPTRRYLSDISEIRSFVMQLSIGNSTSSQELPREVCPHGCGADRWVTAVLCPQCKT